MLVLQLPIEDGFARRSSHNQQLGLGLEESAKHKSLREDSGVTIGPRGPRREKDARCWIPPRCMQASKPSTLLEVLLLNFFLLVG